MKAITFSRAAIVDWRGDIVGGTGTAAAGSGAFQTAVTFPTVRGEPAGTTTPEELLAASHAACYAIGLRSVIKRSGGSADRVTVTATVTAEKNAGKIRLLSSHLVAAVRGLTALDRTALDRCAQEALLDCTISNALATNVAVTHEVVAE